jgi:hypothetical protein
VREVAFTLKGKRYRLTRDQVLERLKRVTPEPPQKHVVEVDGRLFPVKHAFAVATGVDRGDFITTQARDILQRLEFRLRTVDDAYPESERRDEAQSASVPLGTGTLTRGEALDKAIQLYADRPDATPEKILEAAHLFDAWLQGKRDHAGAGPER